MTSQNWDFANANSKKPTTIPKVSNELWRKKIYKWINIRFMGPSKWSNKFSIFFSTPKMALKQRNGCIHQKKKQLYIFINFRQSFKVCYRKKIDLCRRMETIKRIATKEKINRTHTHTHTVSVTMSKTKSLVNKKSQSVKMPTQRLNRFVLHLMTSLFFSHIPLVFLWPFFNDFF